MFASVVPCPAHLDRGGASTRLMQYLIPGLPAEAKSCVALTGVRALIGFG